MNLQIAQTQGDKQLSILKLDGINTNTAAMYIFFSSWNWHFYVFQFKLICHKCMDNVRWLTCVEQFCLTKLGGNNLLSGLSPVHM